MHRPRILIVDDNEEYVENLTMLLDDKYECLAAHSGDRALAMLNEAAVDLLMLDLQLGQGLNGFDVLQRLRATGSTLPVVVITVDDNSSNAVKALKLGAQDFLGKTPSRLDLDVTLERVLHEAELVRENEAYRSEICRLSGDGALVGDSPAMKELNAQIGRIAPTDFTVLLSGASGTGKELVAKAIHETSARRDRPMVIADCSTLNTGLTESALFGHEPGAYTGATHRRIGCFELAHGGSIFIDEIGDLSAEAQGKLLRVLETGEFQRLGSSMMKRVDVRVIAATHRDLEQMVRERLFRADLYYRLAVTPVRVPSLCERKSDIPQLADVLLFREQKGKYRNVTGFSPAAMDALMAHEWNGNVRELRNTVQYALTYADGPVITQQNLPPCFQSCPGIEPYESAKERALTAFQSEYWTRLQRQCSGNKTRMAKEAQITRAGLDKILSTYKLTALMGDTEPSLLEDGE
jgi:DNA-binding NtrC family response regulator